MKIAFVKMKFVLYGGAETYLSLLADQCSRHGHDVYLVTTDWPADRAANMQVVSVSCCTRSRASRLRSFSQAAAETVAKGEFDVVFSLDRTERQDIWRAAENVHAVWLQRRHEFEPRWKTWFNEHSSGHKAILDLERRCVESTPHIIANSHMVKRYILDTHGIADERVSVIHNGIDLDLYSPGNRSADRRATREQLGIPEADEVILFVGSGFRHKGLAEALQVLARLEGAVMLVLGRDRLPRWRKMAQRLGVTGRVRFMGPVHASPAMYRAADVTLLPSWSDSFGFVGLESLACGTPLVTTAYAGCSELVKRGFSGDVVASPARREELAAALTRELEKGVSEERARSISGSVQDYSVEANAQKTMQVIEAAAKR